MNKEELKTAIVDLLYDLHSFNLLNKQVIESISIRFKVDADRLCIDNGITYFIEE